MTIRDDYTILSGGVIEFLATIDTRKIFRIINLDTEERLYDVSSLKFGVTAISLNQIRLTKNKDLRISNRLRIEYDADDSASSGVTSVNGYTGVVILTKGDLALSNVDNTSDANKPISNATQTALNNKADLVGGVIPSSQIPAVAISDFLGTVTNQTAMLALVGQRGDWCIRTDEGRTYILIADTPTLISSWQYVVTPTSPVTSVNGQVGVVVLSKSDIGLSNVPNLDTSTTTNITDTSSKRFVTDVEKATWNAKADVIQTVTITQLNALTGMSAGAQAYCDILGYVVWNGLFWEKTDALQENLIGTISGNVVPLQVTSGAGGGSVVTEIPENQAWWNGSVPLARLGQASVRITTGAGARQPLASNPNFRLYPSVRLYFSATLSFVGGQVDFTTDSVLQCWGYLDSFSTATPSNGFYFRPPRVGETNFLKFVVRIVGAETIADTTIPYDSTSRRYVKGDIIWDGVNMHFWATDTTNRSLNTIPNFLTTYPSLAPLNLGFGFLNARSASTTPIARNINVDTVSYKIY